jgi:hypothetical protein
MRKRKHILRTQQPSWHCWQLANGSYIMFDNDFHDKLLGHEFVSKALDYLQQQKDEFMKTAIDVNEYLERTAARDLEAGRWDRTWGTCAS